MVRVVGLVGVRAGHWPLDLGLGHESFFPCRISFQIKALVFLVRQSLKFSN
jgi:hypothetical protein